MVYSILSFSVGERIIVAFKMFMNGKKHSAESTE